MTRAEVIRELRERGYNGPVSRTLVELQEALRRVRAAGPATTPATGAEPAKRRDSHLDRLLDWGGLDRSLEFQVTDEPGWFHFMAHVTNVNTGDHWVDAYGGAGKHRRHRAFRVERIKVRRGKPVTRKCRRHDELEELVEGTKELIDELTEDEGP